MPAIYYGDEIGMRYLPGLPDKEGSDLSTRRYNRAGARTPMQWDDSRECRLLHRARRPAVPADRPELRAGRRCAAQLGDESRRCSWCAACRAAKLRAGARATAATTVLHTDYPFVYVRGERYLVVVNPRLEPAALELPVAIRGARSREVRGVSLDGSAVVADGFSYGVFELSPSER